MRLSEQTMQAIERFQTRIGQAPAIEVMWLFGSRANGTESSDSDYDLAVALTFDAEFDHIRFAEDFAFELAQMTDKPVSVVDINRVPVPLAANIVNEGQVVYCSSDLRLRAEEQRVWSLWEAFKHAHEQQQQAI